VPQETFYFSANATCSVARDSDRSADPKNALCRKRSRRARSRSVCVQTRTKRGGFLYRRGYLEQGLTVTYRALAASDRSVGCAAFGYIGGGVVVGGYAAPFRHSTDPCRIDSDLGSIWATSKRLLTTHRHTRRAIIMLKMARTRSARCNAGCDQSGAGKPML